MQVAKRGTNKPIHALIITVRSAGVTAKLIRMSVSRKRLALQRLRLVHVSRVILLNCSENILAIYVDAFEMRRRFIILDLPFLVG